MFLVNNLKMIIIGMRYLIKMVPLLMTIKTLLILNQTLIKLMINKNLQNMDKILLIFQILMDNIYKKINQIKNNHQKITIIELIQVHLIILLIFILVNQDYQMMTLLVVSLEVTVLIIIGTMKIIKIITQIIYIFISIHMKKRMKIKIKMINKFLYL